VTNQQYCPVHPLECPLDGGLHVGQYEKHDCGLLPSLHAAAFVRRTTSLTDLHPFLKRSLYLIRFNHFIVYTRCETVLKRNVITHTLYFHIYTSMQHT
jgi:hypothetical protein